MKYKSNNHFPDLYRMFLMEGPNFSEIAGKIMDYASGHRLLFPYEANRQIALFIFKYYNGDIRKLLIKT